ncbi:E3 ubiquitin-protein ligase RNF6 isoform X2 [Heteronotia binoei]|uniref:E3 ubiquitin-protein ligase RNF6 isoform X2 n=1 Tax=Heteronotia binoei TaxID=13085 RepID=UPI002931B11B|nr:E3 ubiquitin-protein ligase RNF6 isoform X2 [Heteronotia binoei]
MCNVSGEITADELQQRLQGAKEHLVSRDDSENTEGDAVRYSEILGLNPANVSLPEWQSMFHRAGNSTRSSEQRGNQPWRAVSRVTPTNGGFRFSLEINIDHEYNGGDSPTEEFDGISHGYMVRSHAENTSPVADSPIASRTRSRVVRETFSHALASSESGSISDSVAQSGEETPRLFLGRHSSRNSSLATHTFLDDNEHNIIRQRRVQRVTSVRLHSRRARARNWRRARQRSEALRSQSQTLLEGQQHRDTQETQRRSRRMHTVHSPPQQGEMQVPSLDIIVEEEESGRSTTILRRHPAITLDLQVRRIPPGAYRDRQRIGIRTLSGAGMAENLVASESNSEGFHWTVLQPEHTGMQTYGSAIPPHRISETGLRESSSVAVGSVIRQIMTELGELSSLIDIDNEIRRSVRHLSEMQSELSDLQNLSSIGEFRDASLESSPAEHDRREWQGETSAVQDGHHGDGAQDNSQFQDTSNLTGNGTLSILRLMPDLLLDNYTNDRLRGLTKDQMDSLSTRSYGTTIAEESERSMTCSVCINDYVVGSKLRQLPCKHEFHFHCIDRWLSENSTCPICRQSVVN